MGSSMNLALPAIGREFGLGAVGLGWVASAYLLAAAMVLIPAGRLADLFGRKRIFICGVVIYTAASAVLALSPSAGVLTGFRAAQGMGGAMVFGTAVALLISVYPADRRGHALGINTAAVYLGLSLGPVLGGVLTQQFGWRSLFWTQVPIGILIAVLAAAVFRGEWAEARGERFDVGGSALFAVSLLALMVGFSRLPTASGAALTAAGAAGAAAFVLMEKRIKAPVFDVRLLVRNRVYGFSNLAALINYCATSALSFLLSLYLQYVKGMTPQAAGLVLVAQPVVMTVFSPLAGRASDRRDPRILASAGMALSSLGLFVFSWLGRGTTVAFVVGGLLLVGSGFALFSSPNTNAVMGAVEKKSYGVASATLATMRLVGQMLSLGIVMMLFSVTIGPGRITPDRHDAFLVGLRDAFLLFAVLCVFGVFASLARGPNGRRPERAHER
ncbi:MAG: MFS transporter [Candidatus Aminicenantes bacterium]|nr:MFS transporter [Candidatus Aminicenantes bacterium]